MATTKTMKRATQTGSRGTTKSTKRGAMHAWTNVQERTLRQLAKQQNPRLTADQIGHKLSPRRTGSAVRQKAFTMNIAIGGRTGMARSRRAA